MTSMGGDLPCPGLLQLLLATIDAADGNEKLEAPVQNKGFSPQLVIRDSTTRVRVPVT